MAGSVAIPPPITNPAGTSTGRYYATVPGMGWGFRPRSLMIAGPHGTLITIDSETGAITLSPEAKPDEAAKAMIELVRRYLQTCPAPDLKDKR